MGRPKLLLPFDEGTVVERTLRAWTKSRVERVIVVVRPDDSLLAEVCRRAGADVVAPDEPPPEMKDSIVAALAYLERRAQPSAGDAWLLAPADMPRLTAAAIDRLLESHDPQRPEILQAAHRGRSGHPTLFPWPLAAEIHRLSADEGANVLVQRHGRRLVEVEDDGIWFDLDTPEDYQRLREGRE
jgi:molybdenum cofactor cytidylyltransferase